MLKELASLLCSLFVPRRTVSLIRGGVKQSMEKIFLPLV